jgi:phosphoribosylaminoimidazole carboxylase (NCAIR synthetase)
MVFDMNYNCILLLSFNVPLLKVSELKNFFNYRCDVLTAEIEHINVEALETVLKERPNIIIEPHPSTFATIQNKYRQKLHLEKHGIKVGPFMDIDTTSKATTVQSIQGKLIHIQIRTITSWISQCTTFSNKKVPY